jgi:hypothetical protein
VLHQALEELLADRPRRGLGDEPQQVALGVRGRRGFV